jgi:hypothetical protein
MSLSNSGTTTREMVVVAGVGALVLSAIALTAYPSLRVAPAAKNASPKALAQPVQVAAARGGGRYRCRSCELRD